MSKNFSEAEKNILSILKKGNTFSFTDEDNNCNTYVIELAGKPTCDRGEPKTDIFIRAKSSNNCYKDFKISFKKENADFLENKISKERAEQIFGANWINIISSSIIKLKNEFSDRYLIYKSKHGRTNEGSITLGWKFEILNKKSGNLSGELDLDINQVVDIYSGVNLSKDKKNASVNGTYYENSGVANYILIEKSDKTLNSTQDIIDELIDIKDYVKINDKVYFACKALNYRSYQKKYDGNRPLAVYVDWDVKNNKLVYQLKFDEPLICRGNDAYKKLEKALSALNVSSTRDLSSLNVENSMIVYDENK